MLPNPSNSTDVGPGANPEPAESEEPLPLALRPVPPMIQRTYEAFLRDLPEMLKTHYRQWVAYHGDQRLFFGRSQTNLIQECLRRGIPEDEFVVYSVEPDGPEYWDDDQVEFVVS